MEGPFLRLRLSDDLGLSVLLRCACSRFRGQLRLIGRNRLYKKSIHNRMPVIVARKDYERWMAPAEPSHLPVDLLKTFPAEEMKAWKVSRAVGNVRNNSPGLIAPV